MSSSPAAMDAQNLIPSDSTDSGLPTPRCGSQQHQARFDRQQAQVKDQQPHDELAKTETRIDRLNDDHPQQNKDHPQGRPPQDHQRNFCTCHPIRGGDPKYSPARHKTQDGRRGQADQSLPSSHEPRRAQQRQPQHDRCDRKPAASRPGDLPRRSDTFHACQSAPRPGPTPRLEPPAPRRLLCFASANRCTIATAKPNTAPMATSQGSVPQRVSSQCPKSRQRHL